MLLLTLKGKIFYNLVYCAKQGLDSGSGSGFGTRTWNGTISETGTRSET
jgi:hypothetical protein